MGNTLTTRVLLVAVIEVIKELLRLLTKQLADQNDTNTELEQHYQRARSVKEESTSHAPEEQQTKKNLERANFYLSKGIQPEVWPTEEEFRSAKTRIQYDPEKLHFAICGNSGSGKSSLINAFRGLKNVDPGATSTSVNETTMSITRYPDPHEELPRSRFIWFDVPGAGTLNVPGWQYFNEQGLFIFDIIILVYDAVSIPWSDIFWQTADYSVHSVSRKSIFPSYNTASDTTSRYSSSDPKRTSTFKIFWEINLATTRVKKTPLKNTRSITQLLDSYSSTPRGRIWTRISKWPIWQNAKCS